MSITTQTELLTTSMPWNSEFIPSVPMMNGDPTGKDLLTMRQFTADDIYDYIETAERLETIFNDPNRRGIDLLRFVGARILMRQPSTRTGGTFVEGLYKVGGNPLLISDTGATSEAKGESLEDSFVAHATQCDVIVMRDKQAGMPEIAANAIQRSYDLGKLTRRVPVINAGDGTNEHPSQALGDLAAIREHLGVEDLSGRTLVTVGDHERYRADHSLLLGAAAVGMDVVAVESPAAPVPLHLVQELGEKLTTAD
jgi:aspartate carbamoyltransferase catalytic subunit